MTEVLLSDMAHRCDSEIAYLQHKEVPFLKRVFFQAMRELGVDVDDKDSDVQDDYDEAQ